jgi:hypothetical protein
MFSVRLCWRRSFTCREWSFGLRAVQAAVLPRPAGSIGSEFTRKPVDDHTAYHSSLYHLYRPGSTVGKFLELADVLYSGPSKKTSST